MTLIRFLLPIVLVAPSLVAQDPPPRPRPAPRVAPTPRPTPAPRPAIAPRALWSLDGLPFGIDADRIRAEAEAAVELHRGEWEHEAARLRDEAMAQVELHRGEWEMEAARMAQEARASMGWAPLAPELPLLGDMSLKTRPRAPWAPADQGDSLYRRARELLNSGEYRRAATTFRDLSTKVPNSAYAPEALYWQAFALYRIGGTEELRSALEAIDQLKVKYPGARMQSETEALGVRIRGALAARGDATSAALVRTAAADSMLRCDREEQAVRVEALNALAASDPAGSMPLLQKTLARKDACSATLRRTAVFLMGSKRAEGSEAALAQVARTDPSVEVRGAAIDWLARFPGEGTVGILEELARDTSDRISRTATRALVRHPSPRARAAVRSLVERPESPERLRLEALSAFDRERSTADDIAWMRGLYGKTENPKLRARLVSTLSNIGGTEVDQWLLGLARDPEVDSDTRRTALRRVGRTLPIPDLARTYDAASERSVREGVIDVLRERTEAEATDKLIDIVKRGTDPSLRSRAISALSSKKDPRTIRLLMEILDK